MNFFNFNQWNNAVNESIFNKDFIVYQPHPDGLAKVLAGLKYSGQNKVLFEGTIYNRVSGLELLDEAWTWSDILHAGVDVASAGLDFVIPGSGSVVDFLHAISYVVEAQFKETQEEKDQLYVMGAITLAFVFIPGPLQAVAVPLKTFIKTGKGVATPAIKKGLSVVAGVLDTVLLTIPSKLKSALASPLAKKIISRAGGSGKVTTAINAFTSRVKKIFAPFATTTVAKSAASSAKTVTAKGLGKAAIKVSTLTPKLVTNLTKLGQNTALKLAGKDAPLALKSLGFAPGKMYRYVDGATGKINTAFIKEIKPDGTVIALFGKKSGGSVLGTQTAVPASTFVQKAVAGPWLRSGASVAVPLFVKRLADHTLEDGEINIRELLELEELSPEQTSDESIGSYNEELIEAPQMTQGDEESLAGLPPGFNLKAFREATKIE
jgi:hypothetical protein